MRWLIILLSLSACPSQKEIHEEALNNVELRHKNFERDSKICHDMCSPGIVGKFEYTTFDKDPVCICGVMAGTDGGSP